MPPTVDYSATLVFFLLVFTLVGAFFLFIHLVMGSFIRPNRPDAEKLTIYECGEPTVGSAWIQFDLRFYVVALLFVIFDVEVAFFFPWATVFGTANQIANLHEPLAAVEAKKKKLDDPATKLSDEERKAQQEAIASEFAEIEKQQIALSEKLRPSGLSEAERQRMKLTRTNSEKKYEAVPISPSDAHSWALIAFIDILVFFGVLMVGFAYVWRRGDIDWVRAYAHHKEPPVEPEKPLEQKVGA